MSALQNEIEAAAARKEDPTSSTSNKRDERAFDRTQAVDSLETTRHLRQVEQEYRSDRIHRQLQHSSWQAAVYFVRVTFEKNQRRQHISMMSRELVQERRELDALQHKLGERAYSFLTQNPETSLKMTPREELRQILDQLHELHREQTTLAREKEAIDEEDRRVLNGYEVISDECDNAIESEETLVAQLEGSLQEKQEALRIVKGRYAQEERLHKQLERQRNEKRDQAHRASDDAEREVLQRLVAEMGIEIGDLESKMETSRAEIADRQPPIEELKNAIKTARNGIQELQKKQDLAKQTLLDEQKRINEKRRVHDRQAQELHEKINERLVELGDRLCEFPIEHEDFTARYTQLNDGRTRVQQLQSQMDQLAIEQRSYDASLFLRGLFIVGGFLLLMIVAIAFVIFW